MKTSIKVGQKTSVSSSDGKGGGDAGGKVTRKVSSSTRVRHSSKTGETIIETSSQGPDQDDTGEAGKKR